MGVTFWGGGLTPLNLWSLVISTLLAPTLSPRLSEYKSGVSLHRGHLGGQRGQEVHQAYSPIKPISLAPEGARWLLHRIIAAGGKSLARPRLPQRPLMPQTTTHSWDVQNAPRTERKAGRLENPLALSRGKAWCLERSPQRLLAYLKEQTVFKYSLEQLFQGKLLLC